MSSGTPITGAAQTSIATQCGSAATGTQVQSADVNSPLTTLINNSATLVSGSYTTTAQRTVGSGGNDFIASGASIVVNSGGVITVNGAVAVTSTGRIIPRPHGALPHSGTLHTASFVDIAAANVFRYDGASPSPNDNYIKIREGTSTAQGGLASGDWIRFVTGAGSPAGQAYTIYRENGTTALAELWGAGQWVELEWDGSQWRYVSSSPWVPNGTAIPGNAAYYGDGSVGNNGVVLYPANL